VAVRLYMDVHVPAPITEALRRRLVEVVTSQEDGTREADDDVLMERAGELGCVLVTQDADLLRIAHEWQEKSKPFAGLVFCAPGKRKHREDHIGPGAYRAML
jgi:predicted nuclease of predicted toxin-antitoxin system